MTRVLVLDPTSPADEIGFLALGEAVKAVRGVPAWLILGGWMVRAWVGSSRSDARIRPTVDVDLGLLSVRAPEKVKAVPGRLIASGFRSQDEPFRLMRADGTRVDLLIPPGASRRDPPRIGRQEVFEAPGTRFAFELPATPVTVKLGGEELTIQVPCLAGAIVAKAVALGHRRPARARVDALDVAALLAVWEQEPEPTRSRLAKGRRRTDVKRGLASLARNFESPEAAGAMWVEQELDSRRESLKAVARAAALLDSLAEGAGP